MGAQNPAHVNPENNKVVKISEIFLVWFTSMCRKNVMFWLHVSQLKKGLEPLSIGY
jgi:hypothetical protein